jgi:hypothetical protein
MNDTAYDELGVYAAMRDAARGAAAAAGSDSGAGARARARGRELGADRRQRASRGA